MQNGLEIARFGGLGERQASPYEIVAEGEHHRLRRYFPRPGASSRPPVVLVPPLMMTAEVWDVSPEASAVAVLHDAGVDPWVVDFGSPEHEEGGLERTLSDHVLAVCDAVRTVRRHTGRDVHLVGYSQGGMFVYQAAAYLRSEGVRSLITFGSPVDMRGAIPSILPAELALDVIGRLARLRSSLLPSGIPSWMTRTGFQLMDPVKTVQQRLDFARRLYDREALQRREGMRRFMEREAWIAFPGPALRDALNQLIAHNRLLQGGLVIGDRTVTLADITRPVLAFVGESDTIAPPPSVRAISAAAPRADCHQAKIATGHFGLVAGSRAVESSWPVVIDWIAWCEGRGPKPEAARPLQSTRPPTRRPRTVVDQAGSALALAWSLGRDALGDAASLVGSRVGVLGRMLDAVAPQLPRLARLAELRSATPIGLGRALAERAAESPGDTFFLFEGRAYSYRDANRRVDAVVRGLLECGVRHGQHVGVLMETRPSAVAATAALSRLGAVAVLLRPDVSLARQLAIAPVDHLLADPEHAAAAREAFGREVLVLGGGGEPRALAPGLRDMEAIDPDRVAVPEWYVPNPGMAGELAFVFVRGDGDRLATGRVTNRRWATSAYGTATACALTARDTAYCCSPTHHPTGILVCVGGALVSGARLAMTRGFDAAVFWDDVRRYGVSVVFYTGTLASALVNAPENPVERNHPLRLFAGSGMPVGVWQRVLERFAPARVVEFFASTEGNAVLVNLTGEKVGSVGEPLPGGAELALARWDLHRGALAEGASGFSVRCRDDEPGLLLSRVDQARGEVEGRPLRGVFEPGDAWIGTGDLLRRDADGDYWLVDHVADVIRGRDEAIPTIPIEEALTTALDFVDLAAVYGVARPGGDGEIPVAAITLRPGRTLDARALRRGVEERLPASQRPVVIRVLSALPMTSGYRIRKRPLRAAGLAGEGERLWLAPGADAYVPFEQDDEAVVTSLAV